MRLLLVGLVLALTACAGTGSTMPSSAPPAQPTVGTLGERSSIAHATCPPSTLGFSAASTQPCPAFVLKIVGGRTLTASDTRSNAREGTIALLFDANGSFLYSDEHGGRLRRHAAYELDVLDTPDVHDIATFEWTLVHQATTPLAPFALRLATVQQVSGDQVSVPASVLSYLVSDGAGNAIGTAFDTMGFQVNFTVPAGTTLPLTLLTFTTGVPQSHCGNCWVTLLH